MEVVLKEEESSLAESEEGAPKQGKAELVGLDKEVARVEEWCRDHQERKAKATSS